MQKILIILFLFVQIQMDAKERFLIGFSQCGQRGDWRQNMEAEMERELMFHPEFSIVIKQALDDSKLQRMQIKELINLGVDVLIVSPNEIAPIQRDIERIFKSGIPVILIDRNIRSESYTAYIGGDNYEIGRYAADYLARRLNQKGNIVEIQGSLTTSPAVERSKGFNDALRKYPLLNNIRKVESLMNLDIFQDTLPKVFNQRKDINAIFSFNDDLALRAVNVYQKKSNASSLIVVGVDGLHTPGGGIELVEKGKISATLIYPTGGKEAIQTASKIIHGEKFKKINLLPTTLVDESNVKITRHQLQNVSELQEDINKSISMLKILDDKNRVQQLFLFVLLSLFILSIVLMIMYLSANKKLKVSNLNLGKQKDEISSQNLELVRLSDELEKVTQEKLRFYTNISHEFRTPLTLISGPIEKLGKESNLTRDQHNLINLARKNIHILLRLIEQIIEFRKYEVGAQDFKPVSADFVSHVQEWNELFTEIINTKNLKFYLEYDAESDYVLDFDVDKMESIYTNLLSNAFKYTPEGGTIISRIRKSKEQDGEVIEVEILNSGKVISAKDIEHVFDRFYQIETKKGSSGIGLALVKAFVEMHQGTVAAKNEEGFVIFKFVIPVQHLAKNELHLPVQSESPIEMQGTITETEDNYIVDDEFDENATTLLVVDDNADIRTFLKMMFQDKYGVIEARNGMEAIKKSLKYVPDLIISDFMMPGIDGIEMCRHLKNEMATSHIPIILLTANVQEENRLNGLESGADDYFSKPVNFDLLEIRVRKLIESRNYLRELYGESLNKVSNKNSLNKTEKNFIEIFEDEIEKNIEDQELSIDQISDNLGISRTQLYRKVKAITSYSPIEYLIIYRLKKAIHLMTITELSIKEIAYQVGFSAPSYFSKCFKKYYTISPSDYLKDIHEKRS